MFEHDNQVPGEVGGGGGGRLGFGLVEPPSAPEPQLRLRRWRALFGDLTVLLFDN